MNKVKNGTEIFTLPKGDGNRDGIGGKSLAHGGQYRLKVSAYPVNLVYKRYFRNAEILRLPPDGF